MFIRIMFPQVHLRVHGLAALLAIVFGACMKMFLFDMVCHATLGEIATPATDFTQELSSLLLNIFLEKHIEILLWRGRF